MRLSWTISGILNCAPAIAGAPRQATMARKIGAAGKFARSNFIVKFQAASLQMGEPNLLRFGGYCNRRSRLRFAVGQFQLTSRSVVIRNVRLVLEIQGQRWVEADFALIVDNFNVPTLVILLGIF